LAIPGTRPETALRLTRTFQAPREKVFRAWTDPEALKEWYGPAGWSAPSAEVDLRAGGGYRIAMKGPDGEEIRLSGTFREVRPPERLVYTWRWDHWEAGMQESLVTVELAGKGGSAEFTLTHERFPEKTLCDQHEMGWTWTLDCLAKHLGG